jgi:hypothetical protein
MKLLTSACGHFVVVDGLHLDRAVVDALSRWSSAHGLQLQDAIQLALCVFDGADLSSEAASSAERPSSPAASAACALAEGPTG